MCHLQLDAQLSTAVDSRGPSRHLVARSVRMLVTLAITFLALDSMPGNDATPVSSRASAQPAYSPAVTGKRHAALPPTDDNVGEVVGVSQLTRNITTSLLQLYAQASTNGNPALLAQIETAESALTSALASDFRGFTNSAGPVIATGYALGPTPSAPPTPLPTRGKIVKLQVGCTIYYGYYDYVKQQSIYLGSRPAPNCVAV